MAMGTGSGEMLTRQVAMGTESGEMLTRQEQVAMGTEMLTRQEQVAMGTGSGEMLTRQEQVAMGTASGEMLEQVAMGAGSGEMLTRQEQVAMGTGSGERQEQVVVWERTVAGLQIEQRFNRLLEMEWHKNSSLAIAKECSMSNPITCSSGSGWPGILCANIASLNWRVV